MSNIMSARLSSFFQKSSQLSSRQKGVPFLMQCQGLQWKTARTIDIKSSRPRQASGIASLPPRQRCVVVDSARAPDLTAESLTISNGELPVVGPQDVLIQVDIACSSS